MKEGTAKFGGMNIDEEKLKKINRIILVGCGTSYHACLYGKYLLGDLMEIPTQAEYASEFRYTKQALDENTLLIFLSQSGETADVIAALEKAKRQKANTLGLINVVGSTIAREVDGVIYLHAGQEIAVASTKLNSVVISGYSLETFVTSSLQNPYILSRTFALSIDDTFVLP